MQKFSDLPEILSAKDIATYLGISRRRVYELLQFHPDEGGIVNFNIGFSKRVHKDDLKKWIENQKRTKFLNIS